MEVSVSVRKRMSGLCVVNLIMSVLDGLWRPVFVFCVMGVMSFVIG